MSNPLTAALASKWMLLLTRAVSLSELARRLDVSRQTATNWLNQHTSPPARMLPKFRREFEDQLFSLLHVSYGEHLTLMLQKERKIIDPDYVRARASKTHLLAEAIREYLAENGPSLKSNILNAFFEQAASLPDDIRESDFQNAARSLKLVKKVEGSGRAQKSLWSLPPAVQAEESARHKRKKEAARETSDAARARRVRVKIVAPDDLRRKVQDLPARVKEAASPTTEGADLMPGDAEAVAKAQKLMAKIRARHAKAKK